MVGCPIEQPGVPAAGSSVIGPEGGRVVSQDQRLTLTIPRGALRAPVEIRVEEVSEQAPGQLGAAFMVSPAGVHFEKPAALTFATVSAAIASGVAPTPFTFMLR